MKGTNYLLNEAMYNNAKRVENASNYLNEDEFTAVEQLRAIEGVNDINMMIDHIEGVQVIEQFEYTFTVKDFFDEIT